MIMEKSIATPADIVRICPASPTVVVKVDAMSMSSRLVRICPDCADRVCMNRVGIISFPSFFVLAASSVM